MAGEIEARVGMSCRYEADRTGYNSDGTNWPAGHPRLVTHPSRYNQVLNYQIPNNSPLRRLYCWEPLREFMRQVLGYATFHRSECPHLALTSKIAGDGDTDGWHFDGNDVVFSILLKEPEEGGLFEYVPYIRSATEENYDAVAAVFAGNRDKVRSPKLSVGDYRIFQGDHTLHRVTPVRVLATVLSVTCCVMTVRPEPTLARPILRNCVGSFPKRDRQSLPGQLRPVADPNCIPQSSRSPGGVAQL